MMQGDLFGADAATSLARASRGLALFNFPGIFDGRRVHDALPRLQAGERYAADPWRPGIYASSCGQLVEHWGGQRFRALEQLPDKRDGYLVVFGGIRVHGIIARAFLGPKPAGQQVRHLDGNRRNNRVDNLAWGTPRENYDDAVRHGTRARKLTAEAVAILRETEALGESHAAAARRLGVTANAVRVARRGLTWRHVAMPATTTTTTTSEGGGEGRAAALTALDAALDAVLHRLAVRLGLLMPDAAAPARPELPEAWSAPSPSRRVH